MSAERRIADFVPPTVPQNLHLVAASGSGLELMWDASTDNVGVAGYEVSWKPDGEQDQASTKVKDPGATLGGLASGTSYTIRVRAFDDFGNHSFWSAPLAAKTE